MLWTTSAIKDYEIEASDGHTGTLNDLLCDSVKWRLRFLVLDRAKTLPQKLTLLSSSLLKSIDRELGKVHVKGSTQDIENGTAYLSNTAAESDLISLNVLRGFSVDTIDGLIGTVSDFLLNDSDWSIRYIIVDTGTWWPGQKVLIAPNSVSEIKTDEAMISLSIVHEKVKNAPLYNPSITVDSVYDEKFLTYYGIRWLEG